MDKIAPYWKAVIGFVAPGAVVIVSSVLEGSDGGTVVTASELITALCAAVITAAGVYAKSNAAQPPAVQDVDGRHEL